MFYIVLGKGILPNWWQGIYDQLLPGIINRLFVISIFWNKLANAWTCQFYYYAVPVLKLEKFRIDAFLLENLTMAHWIGLCLLCRCKWTRKSQVSYENVSEQYLCFYEHKSAYCVYTRKYGCKSMATFGCKVYAFWVHVYGSVGCKVCGSWVRSIWILLGACLCLLGACLWIGWVHAWQSKLCNKVWAL